MILNILPVVAFETAEINFVGYFVEFGEPFVVEKGAFAVVAAGSPLVAAEAEIVCILLVVEIAGIRYCHNLDYHSRNYQTTRTHRDSF